MNPSPVPRPISLLLQRVVQSMEQDGGPLLFVASGLPYYLGEGLEKEQSLLRAPRDDERGQGFAAISSQPRWFVLQPPRGLTYPIRFAHTHGPLRRSIGTTTC